jgi:hypothetical protein
MLLPETAGSELRSLEDMEEGALPLAPAAETSAR